MRTTTCSEQGAGATDQLRRHEQLVPSAVNPAFACLIISLLCLSVRGVHTFRM